MASTKIQNLPLKAPIGAMKIPTGGFGDYSITVSSIGDFIIDTFNLATKDYVDTLLVEKEDRISTTGGYLTPTSQNANVPDTTNDVIDEVAQALLDRIEYVKDTFGIFPEHNQLTGRSAAGTHPSSSISHESGTVYTYLQQNESDINNINNVSIPLINQSLLRKEKLIETDGVLTTTSSFSSVPSTNNSTINSSLQALANRDEFLNVQFKKGITPTFDQKFSNQIGGYPIGAEIVLSDGLTKVVNTVANNTNNPNSNMSGWVEYSVKNTVTSVASIDDLSKTPAWNGRSVFTLSYANGTGLGGGRYVYDENKSYTGTQGYYVTSIHGGTWVLQDPVCFEHFGVTDEQLDQSAKIQKCIDFCWDNSICEYGFENPLKITLSSSIIFKEVPEPNDWGMPLNRTTINMNGATFVSSVNNLTYIRVLRERVQFKDTLAIDGSGSSGQIGIELGHQASSDPLDPTKRRSASFFSLNSYMPANIDIGIKSNIPQSINGNAYGMYNHQIMKFDARHVNIGWYADKGVQNDPVTNKLTRTRIFSFGHIDGACSFYMLACESFKCYGYSSENINKDDSRLPDGKAVLWYSPEKSYPTDTYQNSYNLVSGFCELAYREYINQSVFFTWDVQSWFTSTSQNIAQQGTAALSLSKMGIGSNGTFFNNQSIKDFHFKNGGLRTAVASITTSSSAHSDLPSFYDGKDFYGTVQWIPSANDFEDVGLLRITDLFNVDGVFKEFTCQYRSGVWSDWVDSTAYYGIGSNSISITNDSLDSFKFTSGGTRIAQVAIVNPTGSVRASLPNGLSSAFGSLVWTNINGTEGTQVFYSTYPVSIYYRSYVWGSWQKWNKITMTVV